MTRLSVLALAGHVAFEVAAGAGMPLATVVGPAAASSLWVFGTGAAWRRAGTTAPRSDGACATFNALALAAAIAHLVAWPSRRTRCGVPWLVECEGLGPQLVPAYNMVIYAGGVVAVAALASENRTAPAWPAATALAAVPALVALQRWEHDRLEHRAVERPAWWNRRFRDRPLPVQP